MATAYPLSWPTGRPRTPSYQRKGGNFSKGTANGGRADLTIADAMQRLQAELDRIGAKEFMLSANLVRNVDGSPRSGQSQPSDPGIALYFEIGKKPHCLPCDRYSTVQQNIAALAAHIEATRAIERYGVADISQMFAGFTSLPAPGKHATRPWWEVLGVSQHASHDEINMAYRDKARRTHPDAGGFTAEMSELNVARDQGIAALGHT